MGMAWQGRARQDRQGAKGWEGYCRVGQGRQGAQDRVG